ncbi:hypothetical protein P152DRAFT_71080 [Eremomyces bilateralis CBS 781.70]|uniref:Uncharacterized protein n=1 Tax=Eremomyces bilateralis CBS 781.70 TaxID=1392243 RepID=A0A6G1G0B3_9PEZI|nr:uncharacterized protein P152DRAFT_71080 [Eremomyces bilateralis CBS 781.70]KAF1811366.1 hypothetical protein P152DRAFT_71080 [Eremomyces bilateralis CBS 781.70]
MVLPSIITGIIAILSLFLAAVVKTNPDLNFPPLVGWASRWLRITPPSPSSTRPHSRDYQAADAMVFDFLTPAQEELLRMLDLSPRAQPATDLPNLNSEYESIGFPYRELGTRVPGTNVNILQVTALILVVLILFGLTVRAVVLVRLVKAIGAALPKWPGQVLRAGRESLLDAAKEVLSLKEEALFGQELADQPSIERLLQVQHASSLPLSSSSSSSDSSSSDDDDLPSPPPSPLLFGLPESSLSPPSPTSQSESPLTPTDDAEADDGTNNKSSRPACPLRLQGKLEEVEGFDAGDDSDSNDDSDSKDDSNNDGGSVAIITTPFQAEPHPIHRGSLIFGPIRRPSPTQSSPSGSRSASSSAPPSPSSPSSHTPSSPSPSPASSGPATSAPSDNQQGVVQLKPSDDVDWNWSSQPTSLDSGNDQTSNLVLSEEGLERLLERLTPGYTCKYVPVSNPSAEAFLIRRGLNQTGTAAPSSQGSMSSGSRQARLWRPLLRVPSAEEPAVVLAEASESDEALQDWVPGSTGPGTAPAISHGDESADAGAVASEEKPTTSVGEEIVAAADSDAVTATFHGEKSTDAGAVILEETESATSHEDESAERDAVLWEETEDDATSQEEESAVAPVVVSATSPGEEIADAADLGGVEEEQPIATMAIIATGESSSPAPVISPVSGPAVFAQPSPVQPAAEAAFKHNQVEGRQLVRRIGRASTASSRWTPYGAWSSVRFSVRSLVRSSTRTSTRSPARSPPPVPGPVPAPIILAKSAIARTPSPPTSPAHVQVPGPVLAPVPAHLVVPPVALIIAPPSPSSLARQEDVDISPHSSPLSSFMSDEGLDAIEAEFNLNDDGDMALDVMEADNDNDEELLLDVELGQEADIARQAAGLEYDELYDEPLEDAPDNDLMDQWLDDDVETRVLGLSFGSSIGSLPDGSMNDAAPVPVPVAPLTITNPSASLGPSPFSWLSIPVPTAPAATPAYNPTPSTFDFAASAPASFPFAALTTTASNPTFTATSPSSAFIFSADPSTPSSALSRAPQPTASLKRSRRPGAPRCAAPASRPAKRPFPDEEGPGNRGKATWGEEEVGNSDFKPRQRNHSDRSMEVQRDCNNGLHGIDAWIGQAEREELEKLWAKGKRHIEEARRLAEEVTKKERRLWEPERKKQGGGGGGGGGGACRPGLFLEEEGLEAVFHGGEVERPGGEEALRGADAVEKADVEGDEEEGSGGGGGVGRVGGCGVVGGVRRVRCGRRRTVMGRVVIMRIPLLIYGRRNTAVERRIKNIHGWSSWFLLP